MKDVMINEIWINQLSNLCWRVAGVLNNLPFNLRTKAIDTLIEALQQEPKPIRFAVVGTVKTGKSSLINALLGEDILPVDDIPSTRIPCLVKYAPNSKACMKFRKDISIEDLSDLPDMVYQHLKKYDFGKDSSGVCIQIPPLEIPYDKLNKYIAFPEPTPDILFDEEKFKEYRDKINQENPYDVCELYAPAETLKNGVEFLDLPGLIEFPQKRNEVTLSYLERADAVIYLLDVTHAFTEDEKEVINERLLKLGYTDLMMVANRFDLIRTKEKIKLYVQSVAQEYITNKEVYFVSAFQALEGIKNANQDLIEQSGILDIKRYIESIAIVSQSQRQKEYASNLKNIIKSTIQKIINTDIDCPDLCKTIEETALKWKDFFFMLLELVKITYDLDNIILKIEKLKE